MSSGVTNRLAEFAVTATFDSLPARIVGETQRWLLEYLGRVVGAIDEPAVASALATIRELGGAAQAMVLGTGLHTSAPQAALVNSIASQALDVAENGDYSPDLLQRSGPVLSAALAVGEWRSVSGRDLITALAVGLEVECRVELANRSEDHNAGSDSAGHPGTLGAAVAAGCLLNLEAVVMGSVLRLVSSLAGRGHEQAGSFQVGTAAANGVLAAVLASKGFDIRAPIRAGGQERVSSQAIREYLERLTDGLGGHWDLEVLLERGRTGEPITDEALRKRVHEVVWPYLPRWKEQRLFDLVGSLPNLESVGAIAELLEPVEDGEP